jgi:hypothetical protein
MIFQQGEEAVQPSAPASRRSRSAPALTTY